MTQYVLSVWHDEEFFDAALEWARKAAVACEGPVELRPFQE